MDKDKQIILIAGITILILVLLPYLKLEKFAITESDIPFNEFFVLLAQNGNWEHFSSINNTNTTVSFIYKNQVYNVENWTAIYWVDNETILRSSIPSLAEGTHIITGYKFKVGMVDGTMIELRTGSKTFDVKEIPVNVTVTQYVNQTVYINQTINQSVEVVKEVQIEPTFYEKYGTAGMVFIVMGLIIIYLIYKRTR